MINQIININHESFQNLICRQNNADTNTLINNSDDSDDSDNSDNVNNFDELINKADFLLHNLLEQQKNQLK